MWGVFNSATSSSHIRDCSNSGEVYNSKDLDVTLTYHTGGIVGQISTNNGTIINCVNTGLVSGVENVGGIVGNTYRTCSIIECNNSGIVTGSGIGVGGIAGFAGGTNSIIRECTNTGTLTGSGHCVGGIVGFISGTVEKCVNSGTVKQKGGTEGLGGVVGQIAMNCTAKILNCYNTGKVIEEGSNINGVGGIVGYVSTTGTQGEISHNYNIGQIEIKGSSVTNVGGTIGRYETTTFEINNNYYELNKSNVTLNTLGEGKTAAEMKTQTFVDLLNLNQDAIVWELGSSNNGYPTLKK